MPVPRFLVPLLTTEIGEQEASELLFSSRRGGYLTEGEVRWVFDPAASAIGQGANVKVLQTLLGHKTATLTLGPIWPPVP